MAAGLPPKTLTAKRWLELLSREHSPADEQVILTTKLKAPYALRVLKTALKSAFGKYEGVRFEIGRDTVVSPVADDARRVPRGANRAAVDARAAPGWPLARGRGGQSRDPAGTEAVWLP